MKLYLDIETIPDQVNGPEEVDELAIAGSIEPPKTIKKEETMARWHSETYPLLANEAVKKAREESYKTWKESSLMSLRGQIVCIGWTIDDDKVNTVCSDNEEYVINEFFESIAYLINPQSVTWCGHFITSFDLPFIHNRSKILGIQEPFRLPSVGRPWNPEFFDISIRMPFTSKDSKSLANICRAFDIPVKTKGEGAEVWSMYQDGRFETIAEYCKEDVVATRQVIRRLL